MSKHTKGKQLQISDTANGNQSVTATEIETVDQSGLPLPSADELRKIEEMCPGSIDRILTLVEKQCDHRCKQETKQQEDDNNFRMVGVAVGFIIMLVFVIMAVIFAFFGLQTEALVAIVSPLVLFAIAVLKYTGRKFR